MIDDFGTGHSSLRVLAGLPVDMLKIDRSFVRDIDANRSHRLIVQATVTMAAAMGLETVAEGVETEEQAEFLRSLGCHAIQGCFYHWPAPAAELDAWCSRRAWPRLRPERAGRIELRYGPKNESAAARRPKGRARRHHHLGCLLRSGR